MASKSNKSVARTKAAARSKTSRAAGAKAIRKILGVSPSAALDAARLLGAKRAQLLEAGRALSLRGTARLRKRALVDRILMALGPFQGEPAKPGEQSAAKPAPEVDAPPREPEWREAEIRARKFVVDDSLSPKSRSAAKPSPSVAPSASTSTRTSTRTSTSTSTDANIPWGYGRTRVGALPVDPDRLFVYWEVTDEAVDRARQTLGTAGTSSPLILRLYDTTGRLFDGTNARSCFDQEIDDGSRQRFFDIGKPGSEAFVEIGLRSADRFVKIARSSRVAFPRREPVSAPARPPQWLTVRESTVPSVGATAGGPSGVALESSLPAVHEHFRAAGFLERMPERPMELLESRRTGRTKPGPGARTREAEVFSLPLDAPERAGESGSLEPATFQVDGRTHVVFGPWQVVVRGASAGGDGEGDGDGEKRVVSRWTVYRSWAVEGTDARMPGGRWGIGSSARGGASELRLSGASETLYRGASERRLGGASEGRLGGASGRWPARTAKSTRND
jgi:hypothetical protein